MNRLRLGIALIASLASLALLVPPASAQQTPGDLCGTHRPSDVRALYADLEGVEMGAWNVRYVVGYTRAGPRPVTGKAEPAEGGGLVINARGDGTLAARPAAGTQPAPDTDAGWRPVLGPASMEITFRPAGPDDPLPRLRPVVTDEGEEVAPPMTVDELAVVAGCSAESLPRLVGTGQVGPGSPIRIDLVYMGDVGMYGVWEESTPSLDVTLTYFVHLTPFGGPAPPSPDTRLLVEENLPGNRRENVDFADPAIRVTFNQEVVPGSFERAFVLETRDDRGEPVLIDGTVSGAGASFAFAPLEPLDPGVIYRATVRGGEQGVRTADGERLEADHWWRFSTSVDLEAQNEEDVDPIELAVYQTSRNAPLVVGKRTLTRVTVRWDLHEHIHPTWQPTSFPAHVRLTPQHAQLRDQYDRRRPYDPADEVRVRRPDEVRTEQHRLRALNTVNLYGWHPEWRSDGEQTLVVEVEPFEPYPAPREDLLVEVEEEFELWEGQARNPLFVHAIPILAGEWEGGVPEGDFATLRTVARQADEFTTQLFPVRRTRTITAYGGAQGDFDEDRDPAKRAREEYDQVYSSGIPRDHVVVFFHSPGFEDTGQNLTVNDAVHPALRSNTSYGHRVVRMPLAEDAGSATVMGLVHELGHTFGLGHVVERSSLIDVDGQTREGLTHDDLLDVGVEVPPGIGLGPVITGMPDLLFDQRIEGFRLAPGGLRGANKSSSEGNEEDPDALLPLMWPAVRPDYQTFIRDDNYAQLLDAFAGDLDAGRFGAVPLHGPGRWPSPVSMASLGFAGAGAPSAYTPGSGIVAPIPPSFSEHLLVTGSIEPEEDRGEIRVVRPVREERAFDDGPYMAELVNGEGRVLQSVSFDLARLREEEVRKPDEPGDVDPADLEPWGYFMLTLPADPEARRLVIRRGETTLAERVRGESPPQVEISEPGSGSVLEEPFILAWSASTATSAVTGGESRYTVLYRPAPGDGWRVLVSGIERSDLEIDPARLSPGGQGELRVIVNDGFDEAHADLPVRIVVPPVPQTTRPADGETVSTSVVVEAHFATALDPGSLQDRFVLVDPEGDEIAARILLEDGGRAASLFPAQPLSGGVEYTAVLRTGIQDRHGNRLNSAHRWRFTTDEEDPAGTRPRFFERTGDR